MEQSKRKKCTSVSISFPYELLEVLDNTVLDLKYRSRSDYIIQLLNKNLRKKQGASE